jgi:hypothetical protein
MKNDEDYNYSTNLMSHIKFTKKKKRENWCAKQL